ncbi:MAG: SPFH domain-containing protein, partial [Clostridia bacterium]|nr:SPFH domain-containing protein [Clostridia bacterium]
MEEILLENKKKGMQTLIVCVLIELIATAGVIAGAVVMETESLPSALGVALFIAGFVVMCVAWIPLVGLRILKPQEALALTLFGKYIGTIKGEGFYAINPFCVAVNPAAKTKLNQSGDVGHKTGTSAAAETTLNGELINKKISLKIMTLNNTRQKINDC